MNITPTYNIWCDFNKGWISQDGGITGARETAKIYTYETLILRGMQDLKTPWTDGSHKHSAVLVGYELCEWPDELLVYNPSPRRISL